MADGYPTDLTDAPDQLFELAAEEGLRVYIEFPSRLPLPAAPTNCVNRTATAGSVTAVVTTSLPALCAPAAGSTVSHVAYSGELCGSRAAAAAAANQSIPVRWTSMRTLDIKPGVPRWKCNWTAAGHGPEWIRDFVGGCGTAPALVPGLPTRLCDARKAALPPPPAPPPIRSLPWEMRAVITSDKLPGLGRWRILQPQSPRVVDWCPFCGVAAGPRCAAVCNSTILAAAQVAGLQTAAFGASADELTPLLFWLPPHVSDGAASGTPWHVLAASTKLSSMVSGRFGPREAWRKVWSFIITVLVGYEFEFPEWEPPMTTAHRIDKEFPANARTIAITGSVQWLKTTSTLLISTGDLRNSSIVCCVPAGGNQDFPSTPCTAAACHAPSALSDEILSAVAHEMLLSRGWEPLFESLEPATGYTTPLCGLPNSG